VCTGTSGNENSGHDVRRDSTTVENDSIVGMNNKTVTINKVGELFDQIMTQGKKSFNVDVGHNLSELLPDKHGDGDDLQLPINKLLLESSNVTIPTYYGFVDPKTPFDYLEELNKYKMALGLSDREVLRHVLPVSLQGNAYRWLLFNDGFNSLADFKYELRREFQSVGYNADLRQEMETRYQGPDESLTSFIQVINCYYQRIDPNASDDERVNKVISLMHPEYRLYFHDRRYKSLKEMTHSAREIQEFLKGSRDYRLPPTADSCLEPSLAWVPAGNSPTSTPYEA